MCLCWTQLIILITQQIQSQIKLDSTVSVPRPSQVANLLRQIDEEIRSNKIYNGYIEELQLLISNRENSDLKGLKEKLHVVGRADEIEDAEFDLQVFEMILEKLTHYPSAQKLFFYFLSRVLTVFRNQIMPSSANLSREDVEKIINDCIVLPTLSEMDGAGGHEHMVISHTHVRGMICWLAERCHIRWQSC